MTVDLDIVCSACGARNRISEKVGFRDVCSSCDAWLHSCVNCRFWEKSGCIEPAAEKVRDPEGQNFCEWFKSRESLDSARDRKVQGTGDKEKGRDAAEEMWKKLLKKDS